MAKKSYDVVTHVTHNDKGYAPGKTIVLDDEAAEPLLAVNAIAIPGAREAGAGEKADADK